MGIIVPLPTTEIPTDVLTPGQHVRVLLSRESYSAVVTGCAEDGRYIVSHELLGQVIEEKFPCSILHTDAQQEGWLACVEAIAAVADLWVDDATPWVDPIHAEYEREFWERQRNFNLEHQGRW